MNLRRAARLHQAGVEPDLWHEFTEGDRVLTTEGFFGRVVAVEDGPHPGNEQYVVELDMDMGGGAYSASELRNPDSDSVETGFGAIAVQENGLPDKCYFASNELVIHWTSPIPDRTAFPEKKPAPLCGTKNRNMYAFPAPEDAEVTCAKCLKVGSLKTAIMDWWIVDESGERFMGPFMEEADAITELEGLGIPGLSIDREAKMAKTAEFDRGIAFFDVSGQRLCEECLDDMGYYDTENYQGFISAQVKLACQRCGITNEIDEADEGYKYAAKTADLDLGELANQARILLETGLARADVISKLVSHGFAPYEEIVAVVSQLITGAKDHVASEDYPELSEILEERPPLPHAERLSKRGTRIGDAAEPFSRYELRNHLLNFEMDIPVEWTKEQMVSYLESAWADFDELIVWLEDDAERKFGSKVAAIHPELSDQVQLDNGDAGEVVENWWDNDGTQHFMVRYPDGTIGYGSSIQEGWSNLSDPRMAVKTAAVVEEGTLVNNRKRQRLYKATGNYDEATDTYEVHPTSQPNRKSWHPASELEVIVGMEDYKYVTEPVTKQAGIFDRAVDYMYQNQNPDTRYNPQTGEMASYDWCRFRRDRRCYYPKRMDQRATQQAGYAVWIPEDRGFCPRDSWSQQEACPIGEPGPNSGDPRNLTDATVPWDQGGQRYDYQGRPVPVSVYSHKRGLTYDPEFQFHFTSAWKDVQEKATRIRQDGYVRVISSTPAYLVGEVRGDTNIYQTTLQRDVGSNKVAMWECGCAWAAYSWGRSGRWQRFEGRMCSHALALNYEGQSRGWGGQEITEDRSQPQWRSDPSVTVKVPGDYKKPDMGEWRLDASKTAAQTPVEIPDLQVGDRVLWDSSYWGLGKMVGDVVNAGVDEYDRPFVVVESRDLPFGMTKFTPNENRHWWKLGAKTAQGGQWSISIYRDDASQPLTTTPSIYASPQEALESARMLVDGSGWNEAGLNFAFYEEGGEYRWYKWSADKPDVFVGEMREEVPVREAKLEDTARPVSTDASLYPSPAFSLARDMMADGDALNEITATLTALGCHQAQAVVHQAQVTEVKYQGAILRVEEILPDGRLLLETGKIVESDEVTHPKYSPSRGLAVKGALNVSYSLASPDGSFDTGAVYSTLDEALAAVDLMGAEDDDHVYLYGEDDGDPEDMGSVGELRTASKTANQTLEKGTYGIPNKGNRSVIVGFSDKAKGGEITDEMTPSSKYVVFVEQSGSYRMGRVKISGWEVTASKTAQADSDTGCMIAFRPPDHILDALDSSLLDEDYDNLHVTLAYLGKAADIDIPLLEQAVGEWSRRWGSFQAQLAGYGLFENDESNVLVALLDMPGLDEARDDLLDILATYGLHPMRNHGFTPHMTLAYDPDGFPSSEMPEDAKGAFQFSEVFCVFGGTWEPFPFTGRGATTKEAVSTLYDEGYGDWATERRIDGNLLESLDDDSDVAEYAAGVMQANEGMLPDSIHWHDAGSGDHPEDGTEAAEDLGLWEGRFLTFDEAREAYAESLLDDEPEPALPQTDGDDEPDASHFMGEDTDESEFDEAPAAIVEEDPSLQGEEVPLEELQASLGHLAPGGGGGGPKGGGGGYSDSDIAAAAQQFLAKTSLKDFSPEEQAELINEGEGVQASNLDRLDLAGTHYEALEQAFQEEEEEDHDDMWMSL